MPALQALLVLGEGLYLVSPTSPFSPCTIICLPLIRGLSSPLPRVRERNKPAYEINREACDDYKLCERYAMLYGYSAAYNRYFRQRRGAK